MLFQRLGVLPDDVVKTQVQLVEGQRLLKLGGNLAGRVVVRVLVVDLEAGEHRVFETDVDAHDVIDKRRRFVSLQRRRNRQSSLRKYIYKILRTEI